MKIHKCDKCGKEFKYKNDWRRHINRKYSCIQTVHNNTCIKTVHNNTLNTIKESKYIEKEIHYIYLIKLREFIKCNEDIYKIGKTKQNGLKRIKQYPIGSQIIIIRKCYNCDIIEKVILIQFKMFFKFKSIIGKEYFEGDENDMIYRINFILDNEQLFISHYNIMRKVKSNCKSFYNKQKNRKFNSSKIKKLINDSINQKDTTLKYVYDNNEKEQLYKLVEDMNILKDQINNLKKIKSPSFGIETTK